MSDVVNNENVVQFRTVKDRVLSKSLDSRVSYASTAARGFPVKVFLRKSCWLSSINPTKETVFIAA